MSTLELEEILLHRDDDNVMYDRTQRNMKFVIVGDKNVGKSALCRRLVADTFSNFYTESIDVNYHTTKFTTDGTNVLLQHLDIAGFQRLTGLTAQYYQGSVGALVVFDLTSEKTLETAELWKQDIDAKCCTAQKQKIPCLLVGTKLDLQGKHEFCKTTGELEQYAKDHNYIGFIAVSSLDGTDVRTAFEKLISYVLSNRIEPHDVPMDTDDDEEGTGFFAKYFCCC